MAIIAILITVASSDGYVFDKLVGAKFYHKIWARVNNFVIDFSYRPDSYLQ